MFFRLYDDSRFAKVRFVHFGRIDRCYDVASVDLGAGSNIDRNDGTGVRGRNVHRRLVSLQRY